MFRGGYRQPYGRGTVGLTYLVLGTMSGDGIGESFFDIDFQSVVFLQITGDGIGESSLSMETIATVFLSIVGDGVGASDVTIQNIIPIASSADGIGGGSSTLRRQVDLFPVGEGRGASAIVEVYIFDLKPRLWQTDKIPCRVPIDSRRIPKKC